MDNKELYECITCALTCDLYECDKCNKCGKNPIERIANLQQLLAKALGVQSDCAESK